MTSPTLTSVRSGVLLSAVLCAWVACGGEARAQADSKPAPRATSQPAPPELIELGRRLFEEKALSSSGKISCATCHDPARSFADGQALSKGQTDVLMGRNTPTLFGLSLVAAFPDPAPFVKKNATDTPKALNLDERCVAPLKNPDEMGNDVADAAAAVGRIASMATEFDRTFGGPLQGATAERVGRALGAFVASIEPPRTHFQETLERTTAAFTPPEGRGREIFESSHCTSCHAGPALTDGLMYVTRLPRPLTSAVRPTPAVTPPALPTKPTTPGGVAAKVRGLAGSAGGIYGGSGGGSGGGGAPERQTLTLLDVSRTGPYFRDGSTVVLADAVVRHIQELREVNERRLDVLRLLGARGPVMPPPALRRPAPDPAKRLKRESPLDPTITAGLATHPEFETDDWVPPELNDTQFAYLMDFLGALSPPSKPGA